MIGVNETVTLSIPQIIGIVVGLLVIGRFLIGIGKWVGSVNSDRKNFKEFMQEIRSKIDDILLRLPRKPPSILLESESPLRLNEKGRELSNELDAAEWAKRTAGQVKDDVEGKEAYDIQEFSFKFAIKDVNYTNSELGSMRRVAYQNGVFEGDVKMVFAIELRDRLLDMLGLDAP